MRLLMTFLVILVALVAPGHARAAEVEHVTIYYYSISPHTRHALSANDVRDRFYVRIDIVQADEARKLLDRLSAIEMTDADMARAVDIRLVIDFQFSDGTISTFHASRTTLYSHEGTRC